MVATQTSTRTAGLTTGQSGNADTTPYQSQIMNRNGHVPDALGLAPQDFRVLGTEATVNTQTIRAHAASRVKRKGLAPLVFHEQVCHILVKLPVPLEMIRKETLQQLTLAIKTSTLQFC